MKLLDFTIGKVYYVHLEDKLSKNYRFGIVEIGFNEFKVLYFTLKQALISSILVCLLAIPISKAIFRNSFMLKGIFIKIMGLPFIFPVVSAIFSIILIFGNNGFINTILEMLGFSKISIYGLKGIVIINIFFNLPIAVRFLLLAWNEIPSEQLKLAKSLNVKYLNYFKMSKYTLTKYEKVRILSTRATQLSMGAPPTVNIDGLTDALSIAEKELNNGVLPLKIIRNFPNGDVLEIPVSDMIILSR